MSNPTELPDLAYLANLVRAAGYEMAASEYQHAWNLAKGGPGLEDRISKSETEFLAAVEKITARRAQPEGEAPQAVASSAHDYADRLSLWLSAAMDQHARQDEYRKHIKDWIAHQPAATLSPLCGAQHAESVKEVRPHKIAELLRIYDEKNGDWCAIARAVESRYVNVDSAPGTPEAPKGSIGDLTEFHVLLNWYDNEASYGSINEGRNKLTEYIDKWADRRAAQLDGGQEGRD